MSCELHVLPYIGQIGIPLGTTIMVQNMVLFINISIFRFLKSFLLIESMHIIFVVF